MSEPCFQGWKEEDGNKGGHCCCSCRYQREIVGHPWNKREWTKRPITTIIGWGCASPELDRVVMFDKNHGMCEMYSDRDNVVNLKVVED
jgi:hypothetical protein